MPHDSSVADRARQLLDASKSKFYNPYTLLEWPVTVGEHLPCMGDSLMSLAGTDIFGDLDAAARKKLSFFETVNLFSVILHGEGSFVAGIAERIHLPATRPYAAYLHSIIDEENKHMMLFAEFCTRYAGAVYPSRGDGFSGDSDERVADLLFFARAMVFESLFSYYNRLIATDPSVDPFVRRIHQLHLLDEARHVAFGHELLAAGIRDLRSQGLDPLVQYCAAQLHDFVQILRVALCSAEVYADAGILNPIQARRLALDNPAGPGAFPAAARSLQRMLCACGLPAAEDGP